MRTYTKMILAAGALVLGTTAAQAQTYIGATVSGVLTPGVFGRIDISNLGGLPPLVSPQPVYVQPVVQGVRPVYIYAPAYERANWRRYCDRYHACGVPVYFVDVTPNGRWARPIERHARPPVLRPAREPHRHDHRRDDRRPPHHRHDNHRH